MIRKQNPAGTGHRFENGGDPRGSEDRDLLLPPHTTEATMKIGEIRDGADVVAMIESNPDS
jgi:hypothetical protein